MAEIRKDKDDVKSYVTEMVCKGDKDCKGIAGFLVDDLLANTGESTGEAKIQEWCYTDAKYCDGSTECYFGAIDNFIRDKEIRMMVADLLKQEMSWEESKASKFVDQVYDKLYWAMIVNEFWGFCF